MGTVSDGRARWLASNILPHEPWLRRKLGSIGISADEIDDLVQETYARMISLEDVTAIAVPHAYALTVARSIRLQSLRRGKVVSIEAVADLEHLDPPCEEPWPDRHAEGRQELRRVAQALASLPDRCREVYMMRRVDGLSQQEIADRIGTSQSNVEKHLGRGLKKLMDVLGRMDNRLGNEDGNERAPADDGQASHRQRR